MIRTLAWLAGDVALIYAIDKLGYYRELAALAVLSGAVLWIIGGAFLVSRGSMMRGATGGKRAAVDPQMRAAVEAAERAREQREAAK
jgi:hypothetical protein